MTERRRWFAPLLVVLSVALHSGSAWVGRSAAPTRRATYSTVSPLSAQNNKNGNADNDNDSSEDDAWDSDVDYDKILPENPSQDKSPDPTLGWDVSSPETDDMLSSGKLGIDVGSLLAPLSEKEAAELKAAATEVINEAVAAGIDEIEQVRAKMKREMERQSRSMQRQSEFRAEQASSKLMSKIDAMADEFLANTTLARTSTKLAALADQAMEGRGVDMGTWGSLGGATVVTGTAGLGSGSKGGVSLSTKSTSTTGSVATKESTPASPQSSRLLVVADTKDDAYAKQLIEPLTKELEKVLPDLEVQTIKPTETWPLGGNDAAAVLLFLTSLSDASTVKNGLERLLRQTMTAGGKLAQPPSQIVAISSVGTGRTNQMPYSMQNMMGGGKLGKRKQMEEAVQLFVEQGVYKTKPPFVDYTVCKLGEVKASAKNKEAFGLLPGDVLDGGLDVDSAVAVLKQAIALQPAARNATLSATGGSVESVTQDDWDDMFLRLDGPELLRLDLAEDSVDFDQLVEYLQEWSQLAETSKGLTTPIRVDQTPPVRPRGVVQQHAIQLLYLPTATGARYMSRDEEKQRERERSGASSSSSASSTVPAQRITKEGGLEVLVEVTETPQVGMRLRVRRCNYAPGVVIKELTEDTLLSRIKKTVDVWRNDHASSSPSK